MHCTMDLKEALDILKISQSALSQHVKAGHLRYTVISRHKYDYNAEDVYALSQKKPERKKRQPSIPLDKLTELLNLDTESLRSSSRAIALTDQRRVVASVMKQCGYTHHQIGAFLNRDHSTVSILLKTSYLAQKEIEQAMQQLNI